MFSPNQIPRPAGPPASSTPLHDYLSAPRPGVDPGYVVLPRSLIESMALPWQQQLTYLLAEFHQVMSQLNWPVYRVVPSRYEKLADLDEEQLAEVGCVVEIDADGDLVYRERNGRRIDNASEVNVLVSCLDPILPQPPATPAPQHQNQVNAPPGTGPAQPWR